MPARSSETVVDGRALNRPLLGRRTLLRRLRVPALDAVEPLVAFPPTVGRT